MENKTESKRFYSSFSILENIKFLPPARYCNELSIQKEACDGFIIAIRFTLSKVLYDIVDTYYGILFKDVDSAFVFDINDEIPPEVKYESLF